MNYKGESMKTSTDSIVDITSKQSSAFATGGGGVNFEQSVQSFFLLLLIVQGVSPIINSVVTEITYQTGLYGYRTDDLLVISEGEGSQKKLLCQMKHEISISKSNKGFVETIQRAWDDFCSPQFVQGNDYICLATAIVSVENVKAMYFINQQAQVSSSCEDFLRRIGQAKFSSKSYFNKLTLIREIIDEHLETKKVTDEDLWKFCQSFAILVFDLDYIHSINRVLCQSMMLQHTQHNISLVWSHLFEWSAHFNQSAATITHDNLPEELMEYFDNIIPATEPEDDNSFVESSEQLGILSVIGAWDDNNQYDRQFISDVFAKPYEAVRRDLRNTYSSNENVISFRDGIWKVHHRATAMHSSVQCLSEDQVKNLYHLIGQVLSNISHHVENSNESGALLFSSSAFNHSSLLRNGIVKGVCLLSNLESPPRHWRTDLLQNVSYIFIDQLFAEADWKRWASLGDFLRELAEISPEAYLCDLEKYILHHKEDAMHLIPDKVDLFSPNYVPSLLWSLEVLAWSEKYLIRSVLCLGQLASFDNINKQGNNPISSIVCILLPWLPQTLASVDKQKNALQSLHVEYPDVAWEVILQLLPLSTQFTMGTAKPKYFLHNIPEHSEIDNEQVDLLYQSTIDLAIQWASDSPTRIVDLLKHFACFPENTKQAVIDRLNCLMHILNQEANFSLWIELLKIKYRIMREIKKSVDKAASFPEYYTDLEKLIEHAEPVDIRVRYRRYFLKDSQFNFLSRSDGDPWNIRIKHQRESINEIYLLFGIEEVFHFAKEINDLYTVGADLGSCITGDDMSVLFNHAFESDDHTQFTQNAVAEYVHVHGIESLTNTGFWSLEKEKSAKLLMFVDLSKEVVDFVEREFDTEEDLVWKSIRGSCLSCMEESDSAKRLVAKMSKCGRNRYIINQLAMCTDKLNFFSNDELMNILIEAPKEEYDPLETYGAKEIIKCLHDREEIDKQKLAIVEFVYLKVLGPYEGLMPKALPYILSNNPHEFCIFIETVYKKHNQNETQMDGGKTVKSPQIVEQAYEVLSKVHFIPGVDWNGTFDEKAFESWIDTVEKWSIENDRYEVTMDIIGTNLSYAKTDENGMPPYVIIKTLNKSTNDNMRSGYYSGIFNQRGAHFVDPEGKPEDALADSFAKRALYAESIGYARFAGILYKISESYRKEAKWNRSHNIEQMKQEDE